VALYNGAMLVSPDQSVILNVVTLPEAALLRAFDAARTMPSVGGVVRQDTEATIADRSEPRFDAFVAQKGMKIDAIEPSLPATRARGHMKLLLFVPAGDVAEVSSAMTDVVGPFGARAVVTSDATVEIVPSKASKASSIRQALAMTGIDPRDVVAIGDSQNDVEMLLEMGVGVAMGNCRPEACAAAIAKIGANDTDAIAEFIHRVVVVNACGTSALAE
jgi:hydroxymethylpyrimidine pyrophosphatase-like HAD family hydrolase